MHKMVMSEEQTVLITLDLALQLEGPADTMDKEVTLPDMGNILPNRKMERKVKVTQVKVKIRDGTMASAIRRTHTNLSHFITKIKSVDTPATQVYRVKNGDRSKNHTRVTVIRVAVRGGGPNYRFHHTTNITTMTEARTGAHNNPTSIIHEDEEPPV